MFQYNKVLGLFNLDGIPPAPRGVPQIEVTFDIDANGILSVSAKDKGTNKEQKITIQSSSGLSEDEIQKMVKDAEENAEEDKKRRELVEARNNAEGQVNTYRKDLEKHKDKMSAEDVTQVEDALKAVEDAAKGEDKAAIEAAIPTMFEALGPLMSAMNPPAAEESTTEAPKDDTVVDAEFTEVKKDAA
jgi:molecular chaperone DnaK